MDFIKWIVIGIAVLMYCFVIAFQNKKVWFTSIAALLVIILGMILPDSIFPLPETFTLNQHFYALSHSLFEIINWNVILIYLGSMTIAALLK